MPALPACGRSLTHRSALAIVLGRRLGLASLPRPARAGQISGRSAGCGGLCGLRFHALDRPAAGAVAERELEARTGRLDLEERARPGHHREGRALVADAGDLQDGETSAVERDLARPAIKPVSSDPDLDRFDSDHRHFAAPFGGATRAPVTGHWCRERLFGFDVRLDRTGVR